MGGRKGTRLRRPPAGGDDRPAVEPLGGRALRSRVARAAAEAPRRPARPTPPRPPARARSSCAPKSLAQRFAPFPNEFRFARAGARGTPCPPPSCPSSPPPDPETRTCWEALLRCARVLGGMGGAGAGRQGQRVCPRSERARAWPNDAWLTRSFFIPFPPCSPPHHDRQQFQTRSKWPSAPRAVTRARAAPRA